MMTVIFILLMLAVFGKLVAWAFKAAWGIVKVVLMLICLPVVLIGLAVGGLIYIAIAVLVIIGIILLVIGITGAFSN